MRVLISARSMSRAEEIASGLAAAGIASTVALDGDSAVAHFSSGGSEQIDAVAVDARLPDMSGYDLCRQIRSRALGRNTPILLLIQTLEIADILAGLDAGASGFLTEPFTSDRLAARIGELLDPRAPFRSLAERVGSESLPEGALSQVTPDARHIAGFLISALSELCTAGNRARHDLSAGHDEGEDPCQDASELATPERLRRIVDTTPSMVFTCAASGDFDLTFVSQEVEAQLGYRLNEISGRARNHELLHPDDRRLLALATADMTDHGAFDCRVLAKDGKYRWLHVEMTLLQDADGSRREYVGTAIDLARLTRPADAQDRSRELILQLQKTDAVGRLAASVSHDFHHLLALIVRHVESALKCFNERHPIRIRLEECLRATDEGAGLIRQLLELGRADAGDPQRMDLNRVIEDSRTLLAAIGGDRVGIITVLEPSLGLVMASTMEITQILVNLVVNARDAMTDGGRITLETANVELDSGCKVSGGRSKGGAYVMLTVTDTGTGMDEETQERIFEPFFTTKEPDRGTGLGLPTVHDLVRRFGGDIRIRSKPGAGTTFEVLLPRVDRRPAPAAETNAPRGIVRGTETILVVDDERSLRVVVRQLLENAGYKAIEACDGNEALLVSRQHKGPIHLMLTDVLMPEMDGFELVERMRALRPETRLLLISGQPKSVVLSRDAATAGVMGFIPKPFRPPVLLQRVREALDAADHERPGIVAPTATNREEA